MFIFCSPPFKGELPCFQLSLFGIYDVYHRAFLFQAPKTVTIKQHLKTENEIKF